MSHNMTESTWQDYPAELYTANWHRLFDSEDGRSQLTWENKFSLAAGVAYNFYSPGEEVVEDAIDGETVTKNLLDRIGDWLMGKGVGRHAWVTQEIGKGCKNFAVDWVAFRTCSGGWSYNSDRDDLRFVGDGGRYSAAQARLALDSGELTAEELAQFGFYRRFEHHDGGTETYANLYAPITAESENIGHNLGVWSDANELSRQKDVQWNLLATSIPAMSFAAAANAVESFNDYGVRNLNMEEMRDREGLSWPDSRSRSGWSTRWLHSDFRDVAMPYVYPVFDEMLKIGGLKNEP